MDIESPPWIIANLLCYTSYKKNLSLQTPYQKIDSQAEYEAREKKTYLINYKQEVENIFTGKNELEFTLNTKLSRNGEDNLEAGIHFVFRHQSETQKRFSKQEVEEWSF